MKKSNKILVLCLSFVMLFAAVGGTLAWLTDKDQAENVFTVGSVDIELKEVNYFNGHFVPTSMDGKNHFNNVMPGDEITKTPTITNTGKNDAYVRVVVEVKNDIANEALKDAVSEVTGVDEPSLITLMDYAIDRVFEGTTDYPKDSEQYEAFYDNIFKDWGISYKKTEETGNVMRFSMDQRTGDTAVKAIDSIRVMDDDGSWQFAKNNTFKSDYEEGRQIDCIGYMNHDGNPTSYYGNLMSVSDSKLIYVFYLELEPEESYTLFTGLNVPEEFDTQSLSFFDGLEINIHADAIQAQGFDNWTTAFDKLNAQHELGWWNN